VSTPWTQQLLEEAANAVWRDHVLLADEAVDPARLPARHGRIEVVRRE